MKKLIVLVIFCFIVIGCSNKDKDTEEKLVLATGELDCVYKEQRTNINTLYTSYYKFNYNNNGILIDIVDKEILTFDNATDETKQSYLELMKEAAKSYDDVSGIKANTEFSDEEYTMTISLNVSDMDEENKNDYFANYDRIQVHDIFTDMGYTCE